MDNLNVAIKSKTKRGVSWWDFVAISLIFWIFILIVNGAEYMYSPVPLNLDKPISLEFSNIPEYALRTTLRMFIGLAISIVFSVIYALLAAKVKRLERVLISLLDILQSIPVLGYISFTVTGFIALFPNNILGFELAVIFAIFTCQVWNITYSIYQSIITLPKDLQDAAKMARLNPVQKFFLVEFPYSIPSLVWNMMLSMSAAWFFVVASEAIIEGNQQYFLPGIGSYIAAAIYHQNIDAIIYAIGVMVVVIFLYDQFFFRPLVDWAEKFKYEKTYNPIGKKSWVYMLFTNSELVEIALKPFKKLYAFLIAAPAKSHKLELKKKPNRFALSKFWDFLWYAIIAAAGVHAFYHVYVYLAQHLKLSDVYETMELGLISTIRIVIMMIITIIIWLPISIYIGMRPKIAKIVQPLALTFASFPANLIFPLCVYYISNHNLDPNIWLSFLLIFSMQWYLVFNIVSGVSAMPDEIKTAAFNLQIKGIAWYRKILIPAILPSFLVGAITAWGSAWNATIIVEFAEWGKTELIAKGLGAYITEATDMGEMAKIILGVAVMVFYVELFNRLLWRPIFNYADKMERLK
ncbi:MAG: ABC transporter permease subunit [Rickettsiales bacterium]